VTRVRMGRRPLLGMALGWVLVVVAVATVTFVVVDRAGRGVGQASAARTVAPMPSVTASATSGAAPATSSAPTPSSEPPVTPGPGATPHQPVARTASFTTESGTVVATCVGTVLSLGSITVRDGWRFEKESEDGGLEVKFSPREADGDEVEVVLGCVDGTPTRVEG
jgi:biotin carboxyl carrier protein